MHAKLTYLSFLSLAACLVSSCASDAPEDVEVSKGAELSFAVSHASRASETVPFTSFAVYGDMKSTAGTNNIPTVLFNNTLVEYKDGAWTYTGTKYWFPNHEHSFVALSPSSVIGANAGYSGSTLSFEYAMPIFANRQMEDKQDKRGLYDIVAATHRRLYKYDEKDTVKVKPVSLKFGHLLSMINFAPAFNDNSIKKGVSLTFHKLEITGFRNKASFTVKPAPISTNLSTDDSEIVLARYDGNDNLVITFTTPKTVNNGSGITLFSEGDAIIMLPQAFDPASDAKMIFTYSISDNPGNIRQGAISLRDIEWEPGKSYTYNFTIDKVGLAVGTATIKSWESKEEDSEWIVE